MCIRDSGYKAQHEASATTDDRNIFIIKRRGDVYKRQAVQQLFSDTGTHIIGTRHGEKLFETVKTREERLRSEDIGKYLSLIHIWITGEAKKSILKDAAIIQRIYNWIDLETFRPRNTVNLRKQLGVTGISLMSTLKDSGRPGFGTF